LVKAKFRHWKGKRKSGGGRSGTSRADLKRRVGLLSCASRCCGKHFHDAEGKARKLRESYGKEPREEREDA